MLGTQIFNKVIIDGNEANINEIDNNNGCVHLDAGEHTVEYVFNNKEIPSTLFQNCGNLTHLEVPKHFNIADYALDGTNLDNINDYILKFPSSYYNDKYYVYIGPIKPNVNNIVDLFNTEYTKVYSLDQLTSKLLVPKSIGTFKININESYNDKLYLCVWTGWVIESLELVQNVIMSPDLKDPQNNNILIPNDNKEYIDFGQSRYIIVEFDWKGAGEYTCELLDNYLGIVFQESYELYNENNEIISSGLCTVGSGFDKYYKGIGYCEIEIGSIKYYITEYHNFNIFNKLFDAYDDHLVNTGKKLKILEYTSPGIQ